MGSTSVVTSPDNDYMEPFKNFSLFRSMTQENDEPLDIFASRVAQQSLLIESFCEEDRTLLAKYQVLFGMSSPTVRDKAIHQQWTLEELMTEKKWILTGSHESNENEDESFMLEYDLLNQSEGEEVGEEEEENNEGKDPIEDNKPNKDGKFNCINCGIQYPNQASLTKHRKKDYKCIDCDCILRCLKTFRQHTIDSHQKYYCISCNTYYNSAYYLKKHRGEAHFRHPLQCKYCRLEFSTRSDFKTHMDNTCSECELCLSSRDLTARHLQDVHQQTLKNQCRICQKVLSDVYALRIHMKTIHEPDSKVHECEICSSKFALERLLRSHVLRVHTNKEIFRCDKCDCGKKGFSSHKELQLHIDSFHDKKVATICHICSKAFYRDQALKAHIEQVHEKMKRFKCSHCDMGFYHLSGLTKHSKAVHEKTRDFKCEYCGKLFNRKTVMDLHIKSIHTLEKNYKCVHCGKAYVSNYHLMRHIKEGHEHITKECDICHKQFAGFGNGNLKKHKRAVHGIK